MGLINASQNNFSGMINKSNNVKVIKIERNSDARNFVFIIDGIIPKSVKGVKM